MIMALACACRTCRINWWSNLPLFLHGIRGDFDGDERPRSSVAFLAKVRPRLAEDPSLGRHLGLLGTLRDYADSKVPLLECMMHV